MLAAVLLSLLAVVNGNVVHRRQLAPAAPVSSSVPANLTAGEDTISTNVSPLDSNTEEYYLGFREADFEKPYANLLCQGCSQVSRATWVFQHGKRGAISDNGTLMIAVRSEIPNVTGEQYDWWFGWHSVETARYKLWNPVAHRYSWRTPDVVDWANRTYAERYIGSTSYVDEYVGNDAAKLSISFVEPSSLGFNTTAWPELGIETVVVAQLYNGDYSLNEFDNVSYLMHQVRRMPNGYRELRSRFFVASANHGTAQLGHDLAVHCNTEMTHLGSFLPELFQEFKDTK
ncbi:phloretin hydrolase [Phyllosticta citribraziliensis]|uniref:Phloretin hydrolase n=1 Tax=Phyllosticta citribraziliensis TaxID=989973 RepID=A0ABR1LCR8_9PEZI